jgi:phage pi2 protein 07
MSADPDEDEITSTGDFENAIEDLLDTAVQNEIDVRGSWVYKPDDERGDWEVMIYELG